MVSRRDEPARRAREGVAGTTSSALDAADRPPWRHPEGQGEIWRMAALLDWQIAPLSAALAHCPAPNLPLSRPHKVQVWALARR